LFDEEEIMKTKFGRFPSLFLLLTLAWPALSFADICGCEGNPASLGDFASSDPATHPPGTTFVGSTLTLPLPDDGVLIFDSMLVDLSPSLGGVTLRFEQSGTTKRNMPVTILVAGDFEIGPSATINIDGANGSPGHTGSSQTSGGLGGFGGFRGGDGAHQASDPEQNDMGGYGFGPGGGAPGDPSLGTAGAGGAGTYVGSADLLPLVGGAGGGGGNSRDIAATCGGGGGGGGGGSLLLAANGSVTLNGAISADGGAGGTNAACGSPGGRGSGGAVRILADTVDGSITGNRVTATGGSPGVIRIEAFADNFPVGSTNPIAFRTGAPGSLVSLLQQSVGITSVGGETVSARNSLPLDDAPQGAFGEVDVLLLAPGSITVNLETAGIPAGTSVEVTAKERRGGNLISGLAALIAGNCDGTGLCQAATSLDLAAGLYVLEARATFQP